MFLNIGLSFLSCIAYFLSAFSPFFLWVAPLPLLWIALRDMRLINCVLFFLSYFIGNFLQCAFIYAGTPFPIRNTFFPMILEALLGSGMLWLTRRAVCPRPHWYSCLAFPSFWVAYLYLSILISKGKITSLPIFSQIEWLAVIQIVSVVGLLGIVFLTSLFASGIAVFFYYRKTSSNQAYLSLFFTIAILLFVILFGMIQLKSPIKNQIKVGMAAKNPPNLKTFLAPENQQPVEKAHAIAETVRALSEKGAHYILFPEQTLWVTPENQTEIFQILSQSARRSHVYLFAPMNLVHRSPERNALIVFGPDGHQIVEYFKMHPVSGFEKALPGNQLVTIPLPNGLAGLEICHDMDYSQPSKDYSEQGTGILFVPAADFGVEADGKWHAQVAILQTVANGISMARAAYFGFLSGSDFCGRVLAWQPTVVGQEVSCVVDIPVGSGQTFYARTGDWFAWINCLMAIWFLYPRKRSN